MSDDLRPIIRGALDAVVPAFRMDDVRARGVARLRRDLWRRSAATLAGGTIVAFLALFAGGASLPLSENPAVMTASTPAPAPVPVIT